MRPEVCLFLCSLFLTSSAGSAQNQETGSGFLSLQAVDIPYEAYPGIPELGYAALAGDPGEEGIYVIRLKIPPGLIFPPHHHDEDRHVTVISGVWAFGEGHSGKCEDTTQLTTGAYVLHPKGAVHFDGACGEELVEVQIAGRGPVATTWIEGADELAAFATQYAAAWSSQDPVAFGKFYAENGSLTINGGEPSVGRDAVVATARAFMTAFPDMVVRLVELRTEGSRVEFHWHWTGTNTGPDGTGSAVDLRGYEEWTLGDDGLIVESLGHYDEAEYQRQLHAR